MLTNWACALLRGTTAEPHDAAGRGSNARADIEGHLTCDALRKHKGFHSPAAATAAKTEAAYHQADAAFNTLFTSLRFGKI